MEEKSTSTTNVADPQAEAPLQQANPSWPLSPPSQSLHAAPQPSQIAAMESRLQGPMGQYPLQQPPAQPYFYTAPAPGTVQFELPPPYTDSAGYPPPASGI